MTGLDSIAKYSVPYLLRSVYFGKLFLKQTHIWGHVAQGKRDENINMENVVGILRKFIVVLKHVLKTAILKGRKPVNVKIRSGSIGFIRY